ncbi:hypothetical protein M885DRAFT_584463 [Pelagophyceae sp. CCMP2097]|nr:hypothetical protein M885DRAFT_584463 [Pelagophyceae sp. CCMP2097]
MAGPSFLELLGTAMRAVGTTSTLAMAGAYLRRQGAMTPQVAKGLSKVSMLLAIPCLLFTTAIDCTQDYSRGSCPDVFQQLKTGWPLLLLPIVYVLLGLAVGAAAAKLGGAPGDFKRTAVAAVAFGNSTGLPIVLLAAVASVPGASRRRNAGDDDDSSGALGPVSPLSYLSIYLVVYPVLQWSVGAALLRPKDDAADAEAPSGNAEPHSPGRPRLASVEGALRLSFKVEKPISTLGTWGETANPLHEPGSPRSATSPRAPPGFVSASSSETLTSLLGDVHDGVELVKRRAPLPAAAPKPAEPTSWLVAFERFLPPPVLGALLGMAVAMMAPVRGLLVDLQLRDNDAPLEWFYNGLVAIGKSAVPCNMIILGDALMKQGEDAYKQRHNPAALRAGVPARALLAVGVGKMIVMPALGAGVGFLLKAPWLVGTSNPAALLVAMVVTATPTANNLLIMAELAGENKDGLAAAIAIQYMAAPVLLTSWLTVFMWIAHA